MNEELEKRAEEHLKFYLKAVDAYERLKVCEECDKYLKMAKICSACKCFMPLKTRLRQTKCPLEKW